MAVQIRGLDELEQQLKRVARIVSDGDAADALERGGWVIAKQAQENALERGLADTFALVESIRPVPFGKDRVDIMVGVPYGAAHEYGLPNQPITDKQRRFFWAMWAKTKDTMWKALALSKTYTIPARPYVRPAIDEKKTEAAKEIAIALAIALTDKLRKK